VIPFIQKTWFLWWILATLVILRWFHLLASRTGGKGASETADSVKEKAATGSKQIPSGTASSLLT
jgi:hypothetical protein